MNTFHIALKKQLASFIATLCAALLLTFLSLLTMSSPVLAADSGLIVLGNKSTDGKPYTSGFAVGMKVGINSSYSNTAMNDDNVVITGYITPQADHVGQKADIFMVELFDGVFRMKNTAGRFVNWNGVIANLVPFRGGVTLGTSLDVDIFAGKLAAAGVHRMFIGYRLENSPGLIYTPNAGVITILSTGANAFSFFEKNIGNSIIQTKCVLCHVSGGIADRLTTLIFRRGADQAQYNFDIFAAFFNSKPGAIDYIRTKVSGGNGHVGGIQLAAGSAGFNDLTSLLNMLAGSTTVPTQPAITNLFNGVKLQSNAATVRQAAILLAGRLPDQITEIDKVADGKDATLREVLRNMMQGENFHNFLKDAANDRLLLRGAGNGSALLDECSSCFPAFANKYLDIEAAANAAGSKTELYRFNNRIKYGVKESALELIARVVELDLPYSEILTADYQMMNADLNAAVGGIATFPEGAKVTDFSPGKMMGYYRQDNSVVTQDIPFLNFDRVINPGNLRTDYPHTGVLNSLAFLARYPSTATNRNRARARWTFMHFLGVDIEQSAQRTTDPDALADTNNPTMNNSNCTVCHSIMDPVAGAFQDYGDEGFYKISWGGMDSLDRFYKFPERGGTLYQKGDTWYRDMRKPGFALNVAPAEENSLHWLVQQIISDPRFATAAVKFWWPAIVGAELMVQPEVTSDADYQARMLAYETQEATIAAIAYKFSANGMKLKDLLIDLMMSGWFRASELSGESSALVRQARAVAGIGNEKLLTAEQLARKTHAITGFNWGSYWDFDLLKINEAASNSYAGYYGGIDSQATIKRNRDMTPLMSTVPMTIALESSCGIVLSEFILSDAERKLFAGLNEFITPLSEKSEIATVTSPNKTVLQTFDLDLTMNPGDKKVEINFINDWCDYDEVAKVCRVDRNLLIQGISVRAPDNSVVNMSGNAGTIIGNNCGGNANNSQLMLWSTCSVEYSFNAPQAGTYTITATLTAEQAGTESAMASIGVKTNEEPLQSTANGALLIKQKLVELHEKMLGQTLTITSPEILATYELLVGTWQQRRAAGLGGSLMTQSEVCDWNRDAFFVDRLGFPGQPRVLRTNPDGGQWYEANYAAIQPWLNPFANDPAFMKQSWKVVITYLMTHYNYLYE